MLMFLWLSLLILPATGSPGIKADVIAKIGENITLTCHPNTNSSEQVLEWVKVIGESYEVLYTYQNSTGEVTYPKVHLVHTDKFWHNLTIKRVTTRDAGIYICNQSSPTPFINEVILGVNGSVELRNMVVLYDSPLELTYITDLKVEDSAQWTYMKIDRSQISTIHHIYYATSSGGGLIPGTMGNISKSGLGHGVLIDSSNENTVGKYKYFIVDPPEVKQKEFWVVGTEGLQCNPENAVLAGKSHSNNCSVVHGFGSVIPVFRWTKENETVDGRLIIDPTYTGYGRRWIYIHEFIAEEDDANATFTCKLIFKYDGPGSAAEDTSDPDYTESCNISYPYIDFPVRNITITPSSENVFAVRAGQNLTCSAIGYPEVKYMWTCVGYPSISGQNYTISKLMTETDINECTCFVENTLSDRNTYYQNATVNFVATFASGIHDLPKDVVVRFGESAKLQCTAVDFGNETASWRVQWAAEFDNDAGTSSIIYYSNKDHNGVMDTWQDDFEEGVFKHDLTIKYARSNLAGAYFCMELQVFETNYWKAEVVVTASLKCAGPKSKVKQGEIMTLSCQLEYAGNLKPNIQWFHGGKLLRNGNELESKKEETIVIDHQLQAVADKNPEYGCRVSFRSHNKEIYKDECVAIVEF